MDCAILSQAGPPALGARTAHPVQVQSLLPEAGKLVPLGRSRRKANKGPIVFLLWRRQVLIN
jgi:hypothetical protein